MANVQQLREQRVAAVAGIRQLADRINTERREFTAEERQQWERVNSEYDRTARELRLAEIERDGSRGVGDPDVGREDRPGRRRTRDNVVHTEEQRSLAFTAWCRRQTGLPLTRSQKAACRALRFNPGVEFIDIPTMPRQQRAAMKERMASCHPERRGEVAQRELRANMSAQLGTSGAYLVPPATLVNSLEVNLLAFGGVRQIAEEITTSSGEPLLWPTADDTSNQGVQLGENSDAFSAGVNPTLAQKRWDAYKFSSTPVLIPAELLEDAAFDLPSLIGEMLGIRLGRVTASKYATGSGASTPEGIVTGATLGVTAASPTQIKADEIIDLVHSVDRAYRSQPGVGFLMHDGIVQHLRKLKDGEGRYLWSPGLQDNVPDRLAGYPLNICLEMDSTVATTKKTILFGALRQYKIRRVGGYRLYRLQERFRDYDQDGFVAFIREDGKLLQAGTAVVKYLQQA